MKNSLWSRHLVFKDRHNLDIGGSGIAQLSRLRRRKPGWHLYGLQ